MPPSSSSPSNEAGPSRHRDAVPLSPPLSGSQARIGRSSRTHQTHAHSNDGVGFGSTTRKQTAEQKRMLRRKYRSLIAQAEEIKGNITDHKPKDLAALLSNGATLYKNVTGPTEAVLDSRLLLDASDAGARMAQNIKIDNSFDVEEYLDRLAQFMGGQTRPSGTMVHDETMELDDLDEHPERDAGTWDWDKLGRVAASHSRRAPVMGFLLGPLEIQAKERAPVHRKPKDVVAPAIAPQELNEDNIIQSENETTKLVVEVAKILEEQDGGQAHLFRFVIDPTSFGNTVENLFYVSFLVRDAKVSLEDDDEGEPILTAVAPPDEEMYRDGLKKRQLVFPFDKETWRSLIQLYDIKEAMIPPRQAPSNHIAPRNGWYG